MALILKKRTILLILFIIILIVSIYFMFIGEMFRKEPAIEETQETISQIDMELIDANKDKKDNSSDFFIDYKLERDRLRSQEADYLRELINNPNAAQQARDKAQTDLIALSQKVEKEMIVENLIKAKGFEDAVIFLSDEFANIVVKSDGLQQKQVAQITDIVTKTTGVQIDKITIIERK